MESPKKQLTYLEIKILLFLVRRRRINEARRTKGRIDLSQQKVYELDDLAEKLEHMLTGK